MAQLALAPLNQVDLLDQQFSLKQLAWDMVVEPFLTLLNVFPSIFWEYNKDWVSAQVSPSTTRANGLVISFLKVLAQLFFSPYLYISKLMVAASTKAQAGAVFRNSQHAMLNFAYITIVLMLLSRLGFPWIGVKPEEVKTSFQFIGVACFNVIPHYLLGGYHQVNIALKHQGINTVANIIVAYLGVKTIIWASKYVNDNWPDYGFAAIAAAQAVVTTIYFLALRTFTKYYKFYRDYHVFDINYNCDHYKSEINHFMKHGLAIGFQKVTTWLQLFVIAVLISRYHSPDERSAFTVAISVFEMCFSLVGGLLVGQSPALEEKFKQYVKAFNDISEEKRNTIATKFSLICACYMAFNLLIYSSLVSYLVSWGSKDLWITKFCNDPNDKIYSYASDYLYAIELVVPLTMIYILSTTLFRVFEKTLEQYSVWAGMAVNLLIGLPVGNYLTNKYDDSAYYFYSLVGSMVTLCLPLLALSIYHITPSKIEQHARDCAARLENHEERPNAIEELATCARNLPSTISNFFGCGHYASVRMQEEGEAQAEQRQGINDHELGKYGATSA